MTEERAPERAEEAAEETKAGPAAEETEPEENLPEEEEPEEEITEEAPDNDEDIDAYIRALTRGPEEPAEAPAVLQKEKEPEREMFRVTSQIGEDDYKAFIWYSTLLRRKWVIPLFVLVPLATSFFLSFDGQGNFFSGNFILSLVIVFVAMTAIVVFRCVRWISKIRKNTPQRLLLTDTTIIFMTESAVNIREGNRAKVGYEHMMEVHETKKRFIMYFDNGKSMVFRKEDMPEDVQNEFRPFIRSKAHPKKLLARK